MASTPGCWPDAMWSLEAGRVFCWRTPTRCVIFLPRLARLCRLSQAFFRCPRGTDWQHDPENILGDYKLATELDPGWYQAWHTWALANFETITRLEMSPGGLRSQHFEDFIIPAVQGFLRSIALSPGNSLQDTLRLLTLWFTYGYQSGVSTAISDGLPTVNVDVWLEVIPQVSNCCLDKGFRNLTTDHCAYSHPATGYPEPYRPSFARYRQGPPASPHLPVDRGL
jgi:hypothetical protein